MTKINVTVLQGGESTEHDISLKTAAQISRALDKRKYNVKAITITRDGKWMLPHTVAHLPEAGSETAATKKSRATKTTTAVLEVEHGQALAKAKAEKTDIMFIALHGGAGEDGRIQSLLELVGLPYTGSGPLASGLAMDKARCADVYRANGLHVPFTFTVARELWEKQREFVLDAIDRRVVKPWVVKPSNQGSSVGVTMVDDSLDLPAAIDSAFEYTHVALVQHRVDGDEATCGVVEEHDGKLVALPPTRIVANNEAMFYDFQAKYAPGGSTHTCPADFDEETNKLIQDVAIKAHRVLGCSGMSRTDMIVGDDGVLYVLETNTIPGMTETSLLPEAARVAGIDFSRLLDMLIERGLKRRY